VSGTAINLGLHSVNEKGSLHYPKVRLHTKEKGKYTRFLAGLQLQIFLDQHEIFWGTWIRIRNIKFLFYFFEFFLWRNFKIMQKSEAISNFYISNVSFWDFESRFRSSFNLWKMLDLDIVWISNFWMYTVLEFQTWFSKLYLPPIGWRFSGFIPDDLIGCSGVRAGEGGQGAAGADRGSTQEGGEACSSLRKWWAHWLQRLDFSSLGLAYVILFKNPRFFPMLLTNAGQKSKNFGLANFFIKVSKYKGSKK
jgi:hypothetical protein